MLVFVPDGVDRRNGRCGRLGVDARLDAREEVELPAAALELPGTEGDEAGECQQQGCRESDAGGARARRRAIGGAQGRLCRCCVVIGIMFWFRWYITHNDPASVITTSTIVKISARKVQPPSERAFMCRK